MSYLVLARKWRPQTFEQMRGQDHIVRALRNAIDSGRIAHAYIFTGTRGVGKTTAARVLAKSLNCVTGPTTTPCNQCEPCLEITDGRFPDVLEIDGASNTGVDDVRRLREVVRYPASRGKYRVYIIDEVHMLSTAAFNALLKTLEEPPPHVVFVFATTDPHKIPITILSRCQQYDFKKLSTRELVGLMGDIAQSEKLEIDDRSLLAIAREAEGSVRDAQSLLDQVISYAGQTINYSDVQDVLGVVDRDLLFGVVGAVLDRDPQALLEKLSEAERVGFDVKRFCADLQDMLRDLSVMMTVDKPAELVDLTGEELQAAARMVEGQSWERVHALFDMLSVGAEKLRLASRPDVLLEMTLLKMAKLPPLIALSELGEMAARLGPAPSGGGPARKAPRANPAPAAPAVEPNRAEPPPAEPSRSVPVAQPKKAQPAASAGPVAPEAPVAPVAPANPGEPEEPAYLREEFSQQPSEPAPEPEAVRPPAAPEPVAPPQAAPEQETPTQPAPAVFANPDDKGVLWAAMTARLGPIATAALANAEPLSWDLAASALVIKSGPDEAPSIRMKVDEIKEVLRELTGKPVQLDIQIPEGEETRLERNKRQTDLARKNEREAREHPVVRAVEEALGGEVVDVKPIDH